MVRYVKGKLFRKIDTFPQKITCLAMDDSVEYYDFLKKCHINGFRQIIITSEIMIKFIDYFVLDFNYKIYSIEFMEDDKDLSEEINALLNMTSIRAAYLSKLKEQLLFLSEKSSIEIQRIYFKGRDAQGRALNFYLQSNGIFGINDAHYPIISEKIAELMEGYLF